MARTQWTITVDHFADENRKLGTNCNAKTLVGPRSATLTHEEIVNHPNAKPFRLTDEDDELYYEGFMIVGDTGDAELAPLDDFGGPNAGCTILQMKNAHGKFENIN